jgi:hypothetical protein
LTGFLGTEVFVARIPEAEIDRLKREVAVERLAQARGVELKAHGANLLGLCPFHDDHEPSFVVTPVKNLWHCLGACQAGGSVIDCIRSVKRVPDTPWRGGHSAHGGERHESSKVEAAGGAVAA